MTEQECINAFNEDIEQLLTSGSAERSEAPESFQKMLRLAQTLINTDTHSKSQIEGSLRSRLLDRVTNGMEKTRTTKNGTGLPDVHKNRPLQVRRTFALVLSVFALFTVFTLTIPPIRAFAQDLIRRVGDFMFVNGPTDAEQYVTNMQSGTPTPTMDPNWVCADCSEPLVVGLLTVEEASSKAGFSVYAIGHLPDGYTLSSRDVFHSAQSTTVDTSYRIELNPPLHNGEQMSGIIAVDQTLMKENADPWTMEIGENPLVDVTVRGQDGVWLEQIPIYPFENEQGEWDYARWNQLIWSENGYNFVLQTNMPSDLLPLDDLLKIAESLKP
jgi:hypothetical protein